jgi:uncharacterized damage-inducible protein DinB
MPLRLPEPSPIDTIASPSRERSMSEIALLRYLMDEAFGRSGESGESQSLMGNLGTVDEAMWRAGVGRSVRTIESIALHVGSCKVMYRDHAFGSRALTWESPQVQPWPEGRAPLDGTRAWLVESHARLMDAVSTLTDEDLAVERYANWGELRPTRWLCSVLLQHDVYHAGEINRMRSLLAGEDRWAWQIYDGAGSPLAPES